MRTELTNSFSIWNKTEFASGNRSTNHVALTPQASGPRSKTVMLAKNLPSGTSGPELHDLFSRHGSVANVILPPSGVTAVVEFLEPSEARHAFRKLAYTKVGLVKETFRQFPCARDMPARYEPQWAISSHCLMSRCSSSICRCTWNGLHKMFSQKAEENLGTRRLKRKQKVPQR